MTEDLYHDAHVGSKLPEPLESWGLDELYMDISMFMNKIDKESAANRIVSLEWAYEQFLGILQQINKLLEAEAKATSPNIDKIKLILEYQRELFLSFRLAYYTQPEYEQKQASQLQSQAYRRQSQYEQKQTLKEISGRMLLKLFIIAILKEKDDIIIDPTKWDKVAAEIKLLQVAFEEKNKGVVVVLPHEYAELFATLQDWELFYQFTQTSRGLIIRIPVKLLLFFKKLCLGYSSKRQKNRTNVVWLCN